MKKVFLNFIDEDQPIDPLDAIDILAGRINRIPVADEWKSTIEGNLYNLAGVVEAIRGQTRTAYTQPNRAYEVAKGLVLGAIFMGVYLTFIFLISGCWWIQPGWGTETKVCFLVTPLLITAFVIIWVFNELP